MLAALAKPIADRLPGAAIGREAAVSVPLAVEPMQSDTDTVRASRGPLEYAEGHADSA
jgi:hypothetical protein